MSLKRVVSQGNGTFEARELKNFSYGTSTVQKAYLGTDLVYYNAPDGAILSIQISNQGSVPFGGNVADGDYLFETLISFGGSGTGGEFNCTVTNNVVTSAALVNEYGEGQDWTVNDVIIIQSDDVNFSSQPSLRVTSVV